MISKLFSKEKSLTRVTKNIYNDKHFYSIELDYNVVYQQYHTF